MIGSGNAVLKRHVGATFSSPTKLQISPMLQGRFWFDVPLKKVKLPKFTSKFTSHSLTLNEVAWGVLISH